MYIHVMICSQCLLTIDTVLYKQTYSTAQGKLMPARECQAGQTSKWARVPTKIPNCDRQHPSGTRN